MAKTKKYRRDPQHQLRIPHGWHEDYWPFITPTEYMVYSCIASYADWSSGESRVTFNTIRLDTGVSIDAIRNAVRWLNTIGVMKTEFRKAVDTNGNEYGRNRNFYKITHRANKPYTRYANAIPEGRLKILLQTRK